LSDSDLTICPEETGCPDDIDFYGEFPCTNSCGDGVVDDQESCDDNNVASEDGCAFFCGIEAGYYCPTPASPCLLLPVCGDGQIETPETCDDLNKVSGDGCSNKCLLEKDFQCPIPGSACFLVKCGDGVVSGAELCDDKNLLSGDGCASNCSRIEKGYKCP